MGLLKARYKVWCWQNPNTNHRKEETGNSSGIRKQPKKGVKTAKIWKVCRRQRGGLGVVLSLQVLQYSSPWDDALRGSLSNS